ncbi:MAG: FAD binding domain-containing protein [Pseudomonadota bacterium]|nr:FAD binding domain-containing protein [Pseudomonadota bacterium]
MRLEGYFEIDQPQSLVWQKITDHSLMAGCIPGCENINRVNDNTYDASIAIAVGIIKARFDVTVEVIKEIEPSEVHSRTTGQEGTRASLLASDNFLKLSAVSENKTRVDYISDVSVSGRLGKYGLGMMQKYTNKIADEFVSNFRRAIDPKGTTRPLIPSNAPGSSLWRKFLSLVQSWFGETDNRTNPTTETNNRKFFLPSSLKEAIQLLAAQQERVIISGGATLVAMLNANLIKPKSLVSLKNIHEIKGIRQNEDGSISIGAFSRHTETANSELLTGSLSGVRDAASKIANPTVRNMGTMGGSLAFADPAADYAPALVAADAEVELASSLGNRRIKASDFFVDWYQTALNPGEIIVAVHLPATDPNAVGLHEKFARVEGDYATVSVNIILSMDGKLCKYVRFAIGACGPVPVRSSEVEESFVGKPITESSLLDAGQILSAACDPIDDVRGSAAYRLDLVPGLLLTAAEKAQIQLSGNH